MTKCCMACFLDRAIWQKVARQSSGEGYCERCSTLRAVRIACSELSSEFSILLSLYEESAEGEELLALVQRDWAIFSPIVSDKAALLEDLLPGTAGCKYVAVQPADGTAEDRWMALKDELKYRNRFFPASAPNRDELSQLLGLLVISHEDLPPDFFRARVKRDDEPFGLDDLKAPPFGVAQAGRANPPGLSYLYVASDTETAIGEVRPTVGDTVSVGRFVPAREFKLVDLSDPRALKSPFRLDLSALGNVRAAMGLLTMLSEDLTRPAPPHKAAYEYLATQYLCELIKTLGYDGVRYRSSLNLGGQNFAFFDVDALVPAEMTGTIHVAAVRLDIQ